MYFILVSIFLVVIFIIVFIWKFPYPTSGKIISKSHQRGASGHSTDDLWIITIINDQGVMGDVYVTPDLWKVLKHEDFFRLAQLHQPGEYFDDDE